MGKEKREGRTSVAVQWLRLHLPTQSVRFNPSLGRKDPIYPKNIKNQKQYCNKFNKEVKHGPHQKKKKERKEQRHFRAVPEAYTIASLREVASTTLMSWRNSFQPPWNRKSTQMASQRSPSLLTLCVHFC